ncbi:MAG: glycosyltransferase family 39 protein [Chloroflexota bacterium]
MSARVLGRHNPLALLLLLVSLAFIVAYLAVAIARISYRFELEWMEGAMIAHSVRMMEGEPVYLPPSGEFIPFLYPPLYPALGSLLMMLVGPGFWPLRVISFIASLGAGGLIFLSVRKETQSWVLACVSCALFFASFRATGAWLDIARVDSFLLLLLVGGCYLLRYHHDDRWGVPAAAILFVMAFFTKQTAIIFPVALMPFLWLTSKAKALLFSAIVSILAAGGVLLLNHVSSGWFWFYLYTLPSRYAPPLSGLETYLRQDLGGTILVATAFIFLWLILRMMGKERKQALFGTWALAYLAALAISAVMRINPAAYDNALIPLFAFSFLLSGIGVSELRTWATHVGWKPAIEYVIYAGLLAQFVLLMYNPIQQIPTRGDIQAGESLISRVACIEGKVFMPDHAYYPVMAGKEWQAHSMALCDVVFAGLSTLPKDLQERVEQREFAAIIIDKELENPLVELIKRNYYRAETIVYETPTTFFPLTGYWTRPTFIYLPRLGDDKGR